MRLVLHGGWEGKSGAAAFLSFKGGEAKAQKDQRAVIRLLEGVRRAAGTRGLRALPISCAASTRGQTCDYRV